jgi:RimJ/RimL family protein N-acetyltransferase
MREAPATPAYRIHAPRALLRCFSPDDAPRLKAAIDRSRGHLAPWMPWAQGEPQPVEHKVELLRRFRARFDAGEDFAYAILDREQSQLLGSAGLHPRVGPGALEIGYWIHVDHAGHGLGTEVAAALTRVAFEVERVDRVEIRCDPENHRSAAVARKLRYTHEATLRRRIAWGEHDLRDAMIWTLFVQDYPASPAARTSVEAFDAIGRKVL